MTLKVFHSRRIWYKVIYEKMGISASWSVSWRCQYYQQASSLLVGCSIGLVLLQQMLYHQESWYSSQVDVVCLCPFVWYPALWPVVSAVLRDIVEQAHGGLWRWEVGSYTEYVVLPAANEVFLARLFQCPPMVGLTWVFLLLYWTSFGAVGADRQWYIDAFIQKYNGKKTVGKSLELPFTSKNTSTNYRVSKRRSVHQYICNVVATVGSDCTFCCNYSNRFQRSQTQLQGLFCLKLFVRIHSQSICKPRK